MLVISDVWVISHLPNLTDSFMSVIFDRTNIGISFEIKKYFTTFISRKDVPRKKRRHTPEAPGSEDSVLLWVLLWVILDIILVRFWFSWRRPSRKNRVEVQIFFFPGRPGKERNSGKKPVFWKVCSFAEAPPTELA